MDDDTDGRTDGQVALDEVMNTEHHLVEHDAQLAGDEQAGDEQDGDEQNDATGRLIRPYLMTGGRTEVDEELRLETQLQTTPKGRREAADYRWEAKQILELADQPLALVEISAHAKIPIGVVRVIVSDLIRDGVLAAHRSIAIVSQQSHASLLEKVLNGVRSL